MNTTISISKELRNDIKEFGTKGETYEDIIKRLCKSARERMFRDAIMNTGKFVPVRKAMEEAKAKWQ